jgi:hypothetical protein
VKYLYLTYIRDYRRRFVKCYTNQVLHFEITVISREEGEHAVLKRQLGSSTEDLKTVIDEISLLLMNEVQNHTLVLTDAQMRHSMKLRKSVFDQLRAFITLYVLRKMLDQYKLLTERSTALLACIRSFITIIDLFCSHKIQKRVYERKNESLLLKDVHLH